jgi:hypothetical protein
MRIVWILASLALIVTTLGDAFETILQPRRVIHRFRFARFFYRNVWMFWRTMAVLMPVGKRREAFLGIFGPLSLLGLFITWVIGLIFGFGILHWSLGTLVHAPEQHDTFWTYVYLSGTTFFTLGYGDVTPVLASGRALAVIESGLGFGFLALIIGYLPVLNQAFSHREVTISLLDARAGSPPSAAEMLRRLGRSGDVEQIDAFLKEWERWAAELLESHLSFPVLGYFRSQHDNQSWLAALATMLDTCAIIIAMLRHSCYQAELTFAMCRHAAVDISLVMKAQMVATHENRLSADDLQRMTELLREAGVDVDESSDASEKLAELRGMYEPFIHAIAARLMLRVPPISPREISADNWQRSPGMPRTPGIGSLPAAQHLKEEHF